MIEISQDDLGLGETIGKFRTRLWLHRGQKEDPTAKVGAAGAHLVGLRLSKEQKPFASHIVHYAFGASVGAVYGAVAEMVPRVTAAWGFLSGVAVWFGAHVTAVPALGLADPPTRQPVGQEVEEFGLHLIYGTTTELVRFLLTLALRPLRRTA